MVTNIANVAQMVEQPLRNGQVVGSIPTVGLEAELSAQLDDVKVKRQLIGEPGEERSALNVEIGRLTAEMRRVGQEAKRKKMNTPVYRAITALSEITAKDLDGCTVLELAQLHYWLSLHQGSIFVKTVGRLAVMMESKTPELVTE